MALDGQEISLEMHLECIVKVFELFMEASELIESLRCRTNIHLWIKEGKCCARMTASVWIVTIKMMAVCYDE